MKNEKLDLLNQIQQLKVDLETARNTNRAPELQRAEVSLELVKGLGVFKKPSIL